MGGQAGHTVTQAREGLPGKVIDKRVKMGYFNNAQNGIRSGIEVVITALTRNQVARKGSWVRIPPAPPRRRGRHIVRDDFFIKNHLSLIPSLLPSAKGHVRLACSVVNALATARCRYQPFEGYEGSIPTSEKSKISFSCGIDKKEGILSFDKIPSFLFCFHNLCGGRDRHSDIAAADSSSSPVGSSTWPKCLVHCRSSSVNSRIIRAGTPPTMVKAGTSFATTAPAATMAPSPTVTPGSIVAWAPIQTLFPM